MIKYNIVIEVDAAKLVTTTLSENIENFKDKINLESLIHDEFGWLNDSGIYLKEICENMDWSMKNE